MELKIGGAYHGFTLQRSQWIAEIASHAHRFVHDRTKADLIVLTNDDDQKVFMITFATPPSDHTGVAHIIEHSVLNGSRRFPVKEPFAQMLKSSLYTFLNAMTYPDKTVYPVASRNARDFNNLMDVYLDAVFDPILSESTFRQEGWRFDIHEPIDELEYTGVVYNEMLGAFSDPETILCDRLNREMYPDTIYGCSSGGDPDCIPQLTYDQFRDFHRCYYHPSNSRIFLYGNVDIDKRLAHLEAYLQRYDYQDPNLTFERQPRFSVSRRVEAPYPITCGEDGSRKALIVRGYLLDSPTDPEYYLSMEVLSRILVGTPASPVRKALIDSHLAESTFNYGFEAEMFENQFVVGLKGAASDSLDKMNAVIDAVFQRLVRDGLEPDTIEASMNRTEFQLREANFYGYPKGLGYGLSMLTSWLYNGDPLIHLQFEETLRSMRQKIAEGGYFEDLVDRYFLKNTHQVMVTLIPDNTYEAAQTRRIADELRENKAAMTKEEINGLVRTNELLEKAQSQPDSPESLATIPRLSLKNIDPNSEQLPFDLDSDVAPRLSFSCQPTAGIAYLIFAFDASAVPLDLLAYLPIFAQITLQAGTRTRDYVKLIQEIDIHTGGISGAYGASPIKGQRDKINSFVSYGGKCLSDELPRLLDLAQEIFTSTNFTDRRRLQEIIGVTKAGVRSHVVTGGHNFVSKRLESYMSMVGAYRETTGGLTQFHFLESLETEAVERPDELISKLHAVADALFRRDNIHIHLTAGDEERKTLHSLVHPFLAALPMDSRAKEAYRFKDPTPNEGFIIPSKIQYVGKGINLYDLGYQYNGGIEVLETLLSRDYLWNEVRARGGAYGCFTNMDSLSGNFCCVSYRDPHVDQTLRTFDRIADFLKDQSLSDDDYERLAISTIGSVDAPKTSDQKGTTAFQRYRNGVTHEDVQRRRDETLSSGRSDLQDYVPLFKEYAAKGYACVVGGEEQLHSATVPLSSLTNVFG